MRHNLIQFGLPDNKFWEAYENLWINSTLKSPFQAPKFLKFLASQITIDELATFTYYKDDRLLAAAVFYSENAKFQWLSQLKSDDNQFVIHQDVDFQTMEFIFRNFLQEIEKGKLSFILDRFPEGPQYRSFITALKTTEMIAWVDYASAECPVIEASDSKAFLEQIMMSKRLRRNYRRIKRMDNAEIEVLEDDSDLDKWIEEFAHWHTLRWTNQARSSYASKERKEFLKGCMQAWNKDGLLVRTAIKFDQKRVSLNLGLRLKDGFLGHGQAYDMSYNTLSLGRTLIIFIGEWVAGQNLSYFNFGEGNDDYKMKFANKSIKTHRFYLSASRNPAFLLKARLYKELKKNQVLLGFYREKIRPAINLLVNQDK